MSTDRNPLIDNGADAVGTAAGVRMAIAEAGPLLPLRDAQQLDMLTEEAGQRTVQSTHVHLAARGRGRPRNSKNRQTREVRDYLLRQYAHPLEVLAQIYSRPTDMLAAELGCSKDAALQIQVRAAAEVAPYVEGKMPHQVQLDVNGDFNLLIPGVNIAPEDAQQAADGTFVLTDGVMIDGQFVEVPRDE